jgi:hypothetical protein
MPYVANYYLSAHVEYERDDPILSDMDDIEGLEYLATPQLVAIFTTKKSIKLDNLKTHVLHSLNKAEEEAETDKTEDPTYEWITDGWKAPTGLTTTRVRSSIIYKLLRNNSTVAAIVIQEFPCGFTLLEER